LEANGRGGDLLTAGGTAGSGTGGTIVIDNNGTAGSIKVTKDVLAEARGVGGDAAHCRDCSGRGGDGTGGTVLISGGSGAGHRTALDDLRVDVMGRGGATGSGLAGAGTGGAVTFSAVGSTLSFDEPSIFANGVGGSVLSGEGTGSSGTGGSVSFLATGGTIAGDSYFIEANGTGSSSSDGAAGGDGVGGDVRLQAEAGQFGLAGFLRVAAKGYGGAAMLGGQDGSGSGGSIAIDAFGNSTLSVRKLVELEADGLPATGRDGCLGCSGAGGSGGGGSVTIGERAGGENSILFSRGLQISASGTGSVGSSGSGGIGEGGTVAVTAQAGTALKINDNLAITVTGRGGGQDNRGMAGGGLGGEAVVGARGGSLHVLGNLAVTANGQGGGAQGGTGGDGIGGRATIAAVESGTDGGRVQLNTASLSANGTGGSAGLTNGAGGSAVGGSASLEVRGSLLQVTDNASLQANARGGQGGGGALGGDAQLASGGAVSLLVTDGVDGTRGQLRGGSVIATAGAIGGNGGSALAGGGNGLVIVNSDVELASLTFAIDAAEPAPQANPDLISVTGGTYTGGNLAFVTSGDLSLLVGAGGIEVDRLTLAADNFVQPPNAPSQSNGFVKAGTADIATGQDFKTDANLQVGSDFSLVAPGSITIGGLTSAGSIQLTALTGSIKLGEVATAPNGANTTVVRAGGLARFDGAVTSGLIDITSADLQLGSDGSLTSSGLLQLTSTNAAGMTVGDGVGGGYALSNAEFAKLRGDNILISARADSSAAQDMVLGRLDVSGSQIGPQGTLAFVARGAGSGRILIGGNVAATGFGLGQALAFSTDSFQLNAATGSVGITGAGPALSGSLEIEAGQVHVAESAILDKLAANPFYEGREADLNKAAAVQRPEGVLRAADLTISGASQVLIQNTGSLALPAGILVADGNIIAAGTTGGGQTSPGGPIELIINGQIAGENGTISGPAVWETLVGELAFDPTRFTPGSSVNGCLLTAASCGLAPPRPEPPRFETEPPLVDKLFTKEESVCTGTSPDQLVADCGLQAERLIEEPVTGAGNPALMGEVGGGR
ncbi:MAG TPA: hypothetical protein VM913_03745, partial [Sphingomicrobium sp.]|nr:hypothetical protein [Sphingomicrobium sp.]